MKVAGKRGIFGEKIQINQLTLQNIVDKRWGWGMWIEEDWNWSDEHLQLQPWTVSTE
jgi:hypothetical protein